jgi:pullulanase
MYIQVDERKRTDVPSTTYYQYDSDNLDDRLEQFVQSPVFDKKYSFDGELGALYTPQRTILRLWAPTALSVEVIVYESLYRKEKKRHTMGKGGRGTHELIMIGDYAGTAYKYAITFPDGKVVETVDPYSYATTANGERSVIMDIVKHESKKMGSPIGADRFTSRRHYL